MKINNVVEQISSVLELENKLDNIYIINNLIYLGQDEYKKFIDDKIYDVIKGCIEIKECREYMVSFKFRSRDTKTYKMELRHFLINLFLWYPFTLMPEELNEKWIFDAKNDITKVHEFINRVIGLMNENDIKTKKMNTAVSEVLNMLKSISLNFSEIMNLSISAHTFSEAFNASKDMQEIFFTKFQPNEQPAVIEAKMADMLNLEKSIFKSIKNNAVGEFLKSGEGIKPKQLLEFTSTCGMKPDVNGNTVPIPINGSQLVTGLNKPRFMYLDATGAHKSLITNKKVMGDAGHYSRSLSLLGLGIKLSKKVKDCHTHHFLKVSIDNQKILEKFNGRYYAPNPRKPEELNIINCHRDKDLIGTVIYLRSPAYCACKMHNGARTICHKCFGSNAKLNLDIADGVGVYLIQVITEEIQQKVLSTKHLLTTRSNFMTFEIEFENIFTYFAGDFKVNKNCEKDINDLVLYIPKESIGHDDIGVFFEDSDPINSYISGGFYIKDLSSGEAEWLINDENPKKLYMSKTLTSLVDANNGEVKIIDLVDEPYSFRLNVANNELTKPLYDMTDLTSSSKIPPTADEFVQRYVELLVEGEVAAPSIAPEFIVAALMRDTEDMSEFPDFTFDGDVKYINIGLNRALTFNKSIIIGMCYEYREKQLLSPKVSERIGQSPVDTLFYENVSTDRIKKFYENR